MPFAAGVPPGLLALAFLLARTGTDILEARARLQCDRLPAHLAEDRGMISFRRRRIVGPPDVNQCAAHVHVDSKARPRGGVDRGFGITGGSPYGRTTSSFIGGKQAHTIDGIPPDRLLN